MKKKTISKKTLSNLNYLTEHFTPEYVINICERDTDLAIIKSFICNSKVRNLFFSKIGKSGKLIKVFHSLVQEEENGHYGESDIVFVIETAEKEKFAIFIEDKIAAGPQPSQRKRYDIRALKLGEEVGFGNNYFVFLCAPKKYIETEKAKEYDLRIAHEEIANLIDDEFEKEIFRLSCEIKVNGYVQIKNEATTNFWQSLIPFVKKYYPRLTIANSKESYGGKSDWPIFTFSNVKGLQIVWKTDRDIIDLEFRGMANNYSGLIELLNNIGINNPQIEATGKSLSMRTSMAKYPVSVFLPFNKQLKNIKHCLRKMLKLRDSADKIAAKGITKFPLF